MDIHLKMKIDACVFSSFQTLLKLIKSTQNYARLESQRQTQFPFRDIRREREFFWCCFIFYAKQMIKTSETFYSSIFQDFIQKIRGCFCVLLTIFCLSINSFQCLRLTTKSVKETGFCSHSTATFYTTTHQVHFRPLFSVN